MQYAELFEGNENEIFTTHATVHGTLRRIALVGVLAVDKQGSQGSHGDLYRLGEDVVTAAIRTKSLSAGK